MAQHDVSPSDVPARPADDLAPRSVPPPLQWRRVVRNVPAMAAAVLLAVVLIALLTRGWQEFAQATIAGLVTGSYFALGAVGLSLVYGILRLPNFAQGDFLTFGVYMALWAMTFGLVFPLAAGVGILLTAGLGVVTEFLLWRPMRRRRASLFQVILITIGLAFIIRNGLQFFWGGSPQTLNVDVVSSVTFGDLYIGRTELIATIIGYAVIVAVALMLRFTSLGKQMRALSDNFDLAETTGIDTGRIIVITWILAGALAGLSGILYGAAIGQLTPTLGTPLLLSLFGAVVIGGIGNAYGALIGGVILGLAQEWSVLFVDPRWKIAVGFVALIVTLILRPQGIFGTERGL